jgi:hypothetical protein
VIALANIPALRNATRAALRTGGDGVLENLVAPLVTGDALDNGATYAVDDGTWIETPTEVSYQWYRGLTPIEGATAAEYTITTDDWGQDLTCRVTAAAGALLGTATSNVIEVTDFTGLSLVPDFYIKPDGNDAADGLTLATAWATLSKIGAVPLPAGETRTVRVAAGTYESANDYVLRTGATSGGVPQAGARLNLVYEPGCIFDGTAANVAVPGQNGHEFSGGGVEWFTVVFGNNVIVRNYSEPSGGSPNGFGNRDMHHLTVYLAHPDNCDDGFSCHGNGKMLLYDCIAKGAEKSPFLHVENAYVRAYRCEFYGRADSNMQVVGLSTTCDIDCYDCKWIPGINGQTIALKGKYTRCQFGTDAFRVTMGSNASADLTEIFDSYVHATVDGDRFVHLTRCYGKFSSRVRNGGDVRTSNCVFAEQTTLGAMFYSNFNPGSSGVRKHNNNVFRTSSAPNFMGVDPTNAVHLVNANAEYWHNCLAGSAAFDSDLIAADSGNTVIVGNITADPLIGDADTLDPDDYGYAPGSPCIGAGFGGSNIGFAIGEVRSPRPLMGFVPTP